MKSRENRKQHFIPQCYLKHFSSNKKNLFVYDKKSSKSFSSPIGNIAYKEFFYQLPEKFIKNLDEIPSGTNYYEKEFFAKSIETKYSNLLGILTAKAKLWIANHQIVEIISRQQKEILAQLIAIQYLRLPNIRDMYSDARKKGDNIRFDIIKSFLVNTNPELSDLKNIQISYNEEYNPILHSEIYSDEELYLNIALQLNTKHWVYYISEDNDFYTSDNPIIIKPHIPDQNPYYAGFGMKGAEIIFPIGSSVLLTMWDSNSFNEKKAISDSFCAINDKEKREYNCLQYMFSNEQTYSYNNNFSIIKSLINCNKGKEFFVKRPNIVVNGK